MKADFLLITNSSKETWTTFKTNLASLGILQIATEKEAAEVFLKIPYKLVFIDAPTTLEPLALARKLHTLKSTTPVALMTTTPTWEEAREVLRMGVVDYFPRTLSQQELLVTVKTILQEEIDNEPDNDSVSR